MKPANSVRKRRAPTERRSTRSEAVSDNRDELDEPEPDMARDILWTYANLDHPSAEREAAPSDGAWSMLTWARSERNRFFEQILPKAVTARPVAVIEQEADREPIDLEAELTAMVKKIHRERFEEVPQEIRDAVLPEVTAWAEEFHLDIPAEAFERLYWELAGDVGDCWSAVTTYPELYARGAREKRPTTNALYALEEIHD